MLPVRPSEIVYQSVIFSLQHILAHPVPGSIWSAFVPDLSDARGTVAAGAPLQLHHCLFSEGESLTNGTAATGILFPRTLSGTNCFGFVSLEAEPEMMFIV